MMRFSGKTVGSAAQVGDANDEVGRRARRGWIAGVRGLAAGIALASVAAVSAGAQSAKDSALYSQAQEMVANGATANGRKLADSVANAATPGSAAYAEGLFWRATLAANAQDSEHEYRQIIVDYPLSGRVPAALLRIGQLEAARGENAAALQHFQRLVLEHPLSPLRADGSYWVARMYFEANDPPHGCAANAAALASVGTGNVELKNRIDFQQQRCRGVVLAADDNAVPAATPTRAPAPETAVASKASKQKPVRKVAEKPADKSAEKPAEKLAEKPRLKATVAPKRAETVAKAATEAPTSTSATVSGDSGAGTASSTTSSVANRQPTKEEVARALASAQLKVSSTAAASIERKSDASKSSAKTESTQHDSPAPEAKAPAKSTGKRAGKRAGKSAAGQYAVQVAAFGSKSAAVVLVNKLHGRGYDTYIDGSSAPYRVRIGHYSSHAGAAAELAKLKAKHIDGFVVER